MSLAVRFLDMEKIVAEVANAPVEPEEVEEDWDIAVHPAVTLGPKALAMLEYARMPPAPSKKKVVPPLRGSLQDRYQKAKRGLVR
jgi:hypothetical protein